MFTECVLIAATLKEQIEPKHHEPLTHKSTAVPLEHLHDDDLGTKWAVIDQPVVSVAGVVVQVRNLFSDEVACFRFCGPQTRIVRGEVSEELIRDISNALAKDRSEVYAGAFHFTLYSEPDFDVKDALAADIQSLCRLNSAQMPVLNGMPLVELCWLRLELLRQASADAKQHCVRAMYAARETRHAVEQGR
jgi:hypothetical protein